MRDEDNVPEENEDEDEEVDEDEGEGEENDHRHFGLNCPTCIAKRLRAKLGDSSTMDSATDLVGAGQSPHR